MYEANPQRYDSMPVRRAGASGLLLPLISLGLWQNFGDEDDPTQWQEVLREAFDSGITQFDLANNYGPPPGAAERNFGSFLGTDFARYRDELVITTKAGYQMWPGPYGDGGGRKYLLASLDQSLRRLGLDYVDIFYSHRFDPHTPLVETISALKTAQDSGRALYVGISSYSARRTREALAVAQEVGVRLLVHQPSYSMLNRWIEKPDATGESLLDVLAGAELGCVVFSPLAQGLLTNKYLQDVPADSRARKGKSFRAEYLSEENLRRVRGLNEVASSRGQTLAQMAIAWTLRDERVTSALVGARTKEQLRDTLGALDNLSFSPEELTAIDALSADGGVNLWASRSSEL